jgi:hypothetical protein
MFCPGGNEMGFFDLNPERLYCEVYTRIITAAYVTNRTFRHPTSCSLISIAGSRKELKKEGKKDVNVVYI